MAPTQQYFEGDQYIEGDDEANVLGQAVAQLVRRPAGPPRGRQGQRIFSRPPLPAQAAQPNEAELRSYMGFDFRTWAVGDAADKPIIVEPQESFRGERLVIEVAIPATVTNAPILLLRRIDVGSLPQSPSVEFPAPASMFRPDATGANLDLQIAYRGTKIQVTLGISAAPAGAGVVTASVGMYGQWIR